MNSAHRLVRARAPRTGRVAMGKDPTLGNSRIDRGRLVHDQPESWLMVVLIAGHDLHGVRGFARVALDASSHVIKWRVSEARREHTIDSKRKVGTNRGVQSAGSPWCIEVVPQCVKRALLAREVLMRCGAIDSPEERTRFDAFDVLNVRGIRDGIRDTKRKEGCTFQSHWDRRTYRCHSSPFVEVSFPPLVARHLLLLLHEPRKSLSSCSPWPFSVFPI